MAPTMAILGSTGSIGRQTFDVCRFLGVRVVALTAHSSAEKKRFIFCSTPVRNHVYFAAFY